jgi:uncharacterized protein YdeI (YjbR/CyaY-like superfamily)
VPLAPVFFVTPDELRAWFSGHHETETELAVGFHKKGSGTPGLTWPESVDQALCFGWIDGVRRGIDAVRYQIRFTPRKARSTWSAVNIARFGELTAAGLVTPAGVAAFEARRPERSGIYSYEQRPTAELDAAAEAEFRAREGAWEFFGAQPPSYRKTAIWWVVSAKRPETRARRLTTLIEDSAAGRRLGQLAR